MTARNLPVRAGLAAALMVLSGACQSSIGGGRADTVTLARSDLPAPLTVAVPVSLNAAEGMTINDWGGEVPQSKPVGGVDEGGLADLR